MIFTARRTVIICSNNDYFDFTAVRFGRWDCDPTFNGGSDRDHFDDYDYLKFS